MKISRCSSILGKGLAAITNEEAGNLAVVGWVLSEPATVEPSASERAWLEQHQSLRFAGDPNWLPYEAVDGNESTSA